MTGAKNRQPVFIENGGSVVWKSSAVGISNLCPKLTPEQTAKRVLIYGLEAMYSKPLKQKCQTRQRD